MQIDPTDFAKLSHLALAAESGTMSSKACWLSLMHSNVAMQVLHLSRPVFSNSNDVILVGRARLAIAMGTDDAEIGSGEPSSKLVIASGDSTSPLSVS